MNNDNAFLLLGVTGVGKSTLIKILSEDESIKINSNFRERGTEEIKSYNCSFENFNYSLIDTPGYYSNENDPKKYEYIDKVLKTNKYKIKGILLLISFQDSRFGECQRKGLEKIVSSFPLDNFWDYIILVFTKTFAEDDDELEELKIRTLKDYEEIFDVLISGFYHVKNIKKVNFSSIKIVFINSKKNSKKDNFKELISILKKNSKLDSFSHTMKIEEKCERIQEINEKNQNLYDIFDVKFKVYHYYNEKGKNVKTISIAEEKKFIEQIKKNDSSFLDFFRIFKSPIITNNEKTTTLSDKKDEKIKKLENLIDKLKLELNEEKENNKNLKENIDELKNIIINNEQNKYRELSKKKKELELYNKDKNMNKVNELTDEFKEKENEINEFGNKMPFNLTKEEKILTINFITDDELIICPIICKNTHKFNDVENLFYKKYPEFQGYKKEFIINGNRINKNKTLEENKIYDNSIINIKIIQN